MVAASSIVMITVSPHPPASDISTPNSRPIYGRFCAQLPFFCEIAPRWVHRPVRRSSAPVRPSARRAVQQAIALAVSKSKFDFEIATFDITGFSKKDQPPTEAMGQSETPNHVRDDGRFPPKRSPDASDGCAADHFQPRLLLVAELNQIADAGAATPASATGQRETQHRKKPKEFRLKARGGRFPRAPMAR
jgi:hypothetical protein